MAISDRSPKLSRSGANPRDKKEIFDAVVGCATSLRAAWRARQDSNLQPDRYERVAVARIPREIERNRAFSPQRCAFVHVQSLPFHCRAGSGRPADLALARPSDWQ